MAQDVEFSDNRNVRRVLVTDSDHRPSWSMFDNGFAELRLERHAEAGWLEIRLTETRNPRDIGKRPDRGSQKMTTLTLDKRTAEALRVALDHLFADMPEQARGVGHA